MSETETEQPVEQPDTEQPDTEQPGTEVPPEEEEVPVPPPHTEEPDQPATPAASTPEQWEQRFKKLETRVRTYANAVGQIFEEEAQNFEPCPLCSNSVLGFVHRQDGGKLPREVVNATMRFLGQTAEVEYSASPNHDLCTVCNGHGKVRTGSRVPGNETIRCLRCNGYGYTPPPVSGQNGHAPTAAQAATTAQAMQDFDRPEVDELGEPRVLPDGRENPNYGKWPQHKILVDPWGVTAGLVAQEAHQAA